VRVLATHAARRDAGATAAGVVLRAEELVARGIVADNLPGTSALGIDRDGVGQTLPLAALASGSQARVAAAPVPCAAHEIVAHALAASVSGGRAEIAAARAALAAHEMLALRADARHGLVGACGALGHGIRVLLPLVAALAAFSSASIAAALPTPSAWELVPLGVRAAEIALCLASVATALPISACEWKLVAVVAGVDTELVEPLCDVDTLLGAPDAQHGIFLVRALAS